MATPMSALRAARVRSASAMSGRWRRREAGELRGGSGMCEGREALRGDWNEVAGWPQS